MCLASDGERHELSGCLLLLRLRMVNEDRELGFTPPLRTCVCVPACPRARVPACLRACEHVHEQLQTYLRACVPANTHISNYKHTWQELTVAEKTKASLDLREQHLQESMTRAIGLGSPSGIIR